MINTIICFSQSYSKFYDPVAPNSFDHPESYVIQEFFPSSDFPFDGTIIVQSVQEPLGNRLIQVSLVDQDGNFFKGFEFYSTISGSKFIPTCAAYNPFIEQYVVAGIFQDLSNTASPYSSWFFSLDENLDPITNFPIILNISGPLGTGNFFITDISPTPYLSNYTIGIGSAPIDFVYTGVLTTGDDPSPTTNLSFQKTIAVGYYQTSDVIYSVFSTIRVIDYSPATSNWGINNTLFPSRVIEIPLAVPNGGVMLTGSGPVANAAFPSGWGTGSLFFMRFDIDLNVNPAPFPPASANYYNTTGGSLYGGLYGGDLYYDNIQNEIWFAGTMFDATASTNRFIYQKITNLNNPGITLSNINGSTNNFGRMRLPGSVTGFNKIAKIMPTNDPDIAAVASNIYEDNLFNSNNSTPYSKSYPTLNKINYSNASLQNFIFGTQVTNWYPYPRSAGNIGFGNYLSFLNFSNLFYPAHNAHPLPLNNFPDESYVLGSTCHHPTLPTPTDELIVLNRTENYWTNDCQNAEENLSAEIIPTTLVQMNNPNPSGYGVYDSPMTGFVLNPIAVVTLNDCVLNIPFRLGNGTENSNVIGINNQSLTISANERVKAFKLFTIQGACVLQEAMDTGHVSKDISNLAEGMYIVKLIGSQNEVIATEKVIK